MTVSLVKENEDLKDHLLEFTSDGKVLGELLLDFSAAGVIRSLS